jgi:hypothetical protein
MLITLTPYELGTVRYALDQHIATMRPLIADGERAGLSALLPEFRRLVADMETILAKLDEV